MAPPGTRSAPATVLLPVVHSTAAGKSSGPAAVHARTSVSLPANVPVGEYTVSTYLLRGGALLAQAEQPLTIAKSGFEQFTYRLAYEYSALYGLLAVALAIFTGWLAGVIFRRD